MKFHVVVTGICYITIRTPLSRNTLIHRLPFFHIISGSQFFPFDNFCNVNVLYQLTFIIHVVRFAWLWDCCTYYTHLCSYVITTATLWFTSFNICLTFCFILCLCGCIDKKCYYYYYLILRSLSNQPLYWCMKPLLYGIRDSFPHSDFIVKFMKAYIFYPSGFDFEPMTS